MPNDVDRPTAVANTLAAAVTDTFEGHPGADILKLENTARNRVKREFKRDKMRNLSLQRLYDGVFYISWHVCDAAAAQGRKIITRFCNPIRPYNGGELNANAVAYLVAELTCALYAMFTAVCDAICALCESPPEPPTPQSETTDQPMHAPSIAPIGAPTVLVKAEGK